MSRAREHEHGAWRLVEGDEIAPGRHATRLLGGGRRYEAYLAWDDAMHTLVVAKLLRPGLLESDSARAALAREAAVLASLAHPAIVRSFDAVLDAERPHIVLELLDGPRLSTLVRRYRVIVEQALPLGLELCSALHYLHGQGVLHLDVKPKNVVMTAPPRLIDLSVATSVDEVDSITSPVGTHAYMAPEQCDPARFHEIGPASDVWGLGVTLWEALSRTLPFTAEPTAEAGSRRARHPQLFDRPAPPPKEIPAPLAELILGCLEDRPGDRPTALELADGLEPLVASLPSPRLGLFRPGKTRSRIPSVLA